MPAPPRHGSRRRAETATLRIDRLAAGGAGVGRRASGEVAFIAGAAPGELVEVEIEVGHRSARGRVLRVIEASADRVEPACPHAATCGGCDWMHLAAGAQEREHAAIVRDLIAHALGGVELPEIAIHRAPRALAYRTRARLFARIARGRVEVGYRAAGSHAIVAVGACPILDAAIAPVLGDLAEVLAGASGDGDALVTRGRGGLPVVDLAWHGDLAASTWAALDARVTQGLWAGARVTFDGASKPASFGDPRPVLDGADGAPLIIAPGGFAQPSDEGAAMLARRVDALARIAGDAPHVLELFAGSGTLSILLARGAASFAAVELDAASAACARENLAARGLAGKVTVADADAFAIPGRPDVVVLDPPRTGASGASRAIAASGARAVVYVACDPPTLARDLAILAPAGFALTHLETLELFPQTSHVETLVRLARVRPRVR